MSSVRELVVRIAANVLSIPKNKVTDETCLNGEQCNAVGLNISIQTGKVLTIDNLQGGTVGDLITAAEGE